MRDLRFKNSLFCSVLALTIFVLSTKAFAQYDLMCLYQEARINDSILQAEKEKQLSLRQELPLARAEFLATSDLTSISTINHITQPIGFFHVNDHTLTVTQPVIHFDHWKKYAKATAIVQQANASYAAAEQDLMMRLATAYFTALEAKDQLYFAKASVKAYANLREQTEERYKIGLITITDFEIAKAQHDNSVAIEIEAANNLFNKQTALRAIVGHEVPELLPLRDEIPLVSPEPRNIETWVTTALAQNFELQAGRFGAKAAKDNIKVNQYDHIPHVDIIGQLERGPLVRNVPGPNFTETYLGVEVTVPIFRGGAVNYRTKRAIHDYLRTDRELETLYRNVENDTRQSFQGVVTQIHKILALKQAVSSNTNALKATHASFKIGTRTIVDVLNAQRDLILSQESFAEARYRYILASLKLKQASGILCCEDLMHINAWLNHLQ